MCGYLQKEKNQNEVKSEIMVELQEFKFVCKFVYLFLLNHVVSQVSKNDNMKVQVNDF